jgi:1-pyrroline-5-carboxylate dehydrogenase
MLQAYIDAGVPQGVVNLIMGPGETVGQALQDHPGIDGIVFTGSYAVGMQLFRSFSKTWPRPCIVEMGGKNPAIVTRNADLDEAAEGIMRSAFGFGGQKCSANSRVYVERAVHDELVRLLVEKTETITIGDPLVRENWLGPIIDQRAVDRHQQAVSEARRDGRVLIGGERLSDGDKSRGFFVEPTVVGGLPADHRVFRDEFFAPLTAVHAVDSLDEALTLANDTVYGLTAGVYSEDQGEVQQFVDRIQAGVLYVNREPVRRRARGRASRRSAAGRAAARRARPGCRCTTSRSSCASRARRSSTSDPGRDPAGAAHSFRGSRACPRRRAVPAS